MNEMKRKELIKFVKNMIELSVYNDAIKWALSLKAQKV